MSIAKQMNMGIPGCITIETEEKKESFFDAGTKAAMDDVQVEIKEHGDQTDIYVSGGRSLVRSVKLRWNKTAPRGARVLADAWERGYGDLEWKGICGGRALPWYFMVSAGDKQMGYGVKVRPSSMCFWQMDQQGITLTMDLRCGGCGVWLDGRTLLAAEVVSMEMEGIDSFGAAVEFCKVMCTDPILPKTTVYGSNNWYYAYGESSEEEILSDTDYVLELTRGAKTPPYMVIDDSWQELRKPEYIGGPWKKGNEKFPDMKLLAEKMKAKGVHTGIWTRFLLNVDEEIKDEWRLSTNGCLDPSHPEVLRYIQEDVRRICGWGYELIKHDFSTFDLFGKWGIEMNPYVTNDGWHFYDRRKTSAEVVKMFYEAIYQAAKETDTLILGCNTIGHLGAGLMHINRTGDDTSGLNWERTRRMGINTLAFRLPQHRTFYEVDADCVGIAGNIPWELNRQWADVLAESGTPLFFSAKPGLLNEEEKEELRQILCAAAQQKNHKIPVDWMETDCPEIWAEDGDVREYQWYEKDGGNLVSRPGKYDLTLPLA
ncbi:MAG: alpha-galactosidase [Clostridia bacterium]|nr:alpha-galactosidase [Clostridia bacterium]